MKHAEGKAGAGAIYGTLEVMILSTLGERGPLHGLEIAGIIEERSDELLHVEEGALYPALHRLKRQRFIEGEWRISEKRRRARFYEITDMGREALRQERDRWVAHTSAVNKVLGLEEA
jgi:transcriptional regulator